MRGYINRYYACANKYHEHKCQAKPINADEIEKAIIDYGSKFLNLFGRKNGVIINFDFGIRACEFFSVN